MSDMESGRSSQAEISRGLIAPAGNAPRPGYRLRGFSLPSSDEHEISLSEYRGRSNLVLLFGGELGAETTTWLQHFNKEYSALREEEAQVLAVLCTSAMVAKRQKDALRLCFPILADVGRDVHREYGAIDAANFPAPALYVADQFGEVALASQHPELLIVSDFSEILRTLQFINSQCPECEPPEWPLEES